MKRQKKRKHDKASRLAALGAATAAAVMKETGQTHLPFEPDTLPMNASQPEDDRNDLGLTHDNTGENAPGVAQFDAPGDERPSRETFAMPQERASTRPGARLRAAREAKGMELEQAAGRLRLPQRLLQAIEADDYSRMEHGVYLRGYLTSYARLVNLPEGEIAQAALQERQVPPPLVATGRISHSRWLYQRYSVPAVYLLLTGLIVGPSVWLATHGGLDRNLARLSTLDATATQPATGSGTTPVALPPQSFTPDTAPTTKIRSEADAIAPIEEPPLTSAPPPSKPTDQQPLMASLAPFTASESKPAASAATGPIAGDHSLHLKLSEASWVEISADDGRKLEYAILPAGSERDYRSSSPLSVRIGNTIGAVVVLDGKTTDLAPYRHSNVAYFRAFGPKGDIANAD